MPKGSDTFFLGGEPGGYSPTFSDASFQNERAMWWAEFDSVGEEVVRSYVERNSYTPTGMESARQWLARREFLQLREDVESIRALAERAQETVSGSLRVSEVLALTHQVDANSRAIAEIAAAARKNTRITVLVGMAASLFALCAIVMVLVPPRPTSGPIAPTTKQVSAQPPVAKQAAARLPPPVISPVETQTRSPEQAPATPPENALAIPPENAQKEQPSNASQITSPDPEPNKGQSLAETLAQVADKMGSEGRISFTAQFHDAATGRDHAEQLSYEARNVTIDPNRCQIGYHWRAEQNGRVLSDQDRVVELRLAKSIGVTSIDAESGRRFSVRADPKVYVVHIARWDNASGDSLYFLDNGMAARVATATRRAVKMCENGAQRSTP